jgi:folate-binding protein YgfZ
MTATTVATTVDDQLAALRHGVAIFPLTDRSFLRISGPDATRWLNGMVTNNIKDLAPGQGNYNFLLNSQGRIQGDATLYREPHEGEATFLLETDTTQLETIQTHLDKFIIMDDVELTPEPSSQSVILVLGPAAPQVLQSYFSTFRFPTFAPMQPFQLACPSDDPERLATIPDRQRVAYQLITHRPQEFAAYAAGQGVPTLTPETVEALRILEARPKFGQDIRDKDLPQETALNGGPSPALHFAKGCYLGQEIVERIHCRGNVHRTFTRFTLTGQMPQLPATLEAQVNGQAKPAGELTSAAAIDGRLHALGYLRREFASHPLTYPGGAATPTTTSSIEQ